MAESNFIDYVKIMCRSGHGGAGSKHLHRAKYIPKGGPDGGDGGRGGHIFLKGNRNLWTLIHLKYQRHIFATDGAPGSENQCTGKKGEDRTIEVPCGTWIELRATTSVEDWHFDHWSDGNTDAVRQVEVLGDAHYVAYFAPNCGDYPALPVVALYDWLIMLDVRTVNTMGYYFGEEAVTWYRVRGAPDKLTDGASADDERMGTGYSLTIDQSFKGTGDYYASVDVSSSPSGVLCTDLMRSLIVHYSSTTPAAAPPLLEPTVVRPNEAQRLLRLNPNAPTTVTIYDATGKVLQQVKATDTTLSLNTASLKNGVYVLKAGNQIVKFLKK